MAGSNHTHRGRYQTAALCAALVGLGGIGSVGCVSADRGGRAPLAVPATTGATDDGAVENQTPVQAAARRSREMADRLAAAGDSPQEPLAEPQFDPFADAQPMPTERPETPVTWTAPDAQASAAAPVIPAAETMSAEPIPLPEGDMPELAVAAPPAPLPRSREALVEALVQQLAAETGAALPRAVVAAGLSLAGPEGELDPRLVSGLKPLDREAVERVRDLLERLRTVADTPGTRFDRKTVDTAVAEAFGRQPVSIAHAELCSSVAGYGVYEPLNEGQDADRFLAGQGNRAILYIEVEDFVPKKLEGNQREVRLSLELILYKEHDGLAVWQDGPSDVVDVSRNHRRDFFVVRMVELPARLGPGRYRLKVRVTDPHGDTVDEITLRLLMVADAELLRGE